MSLPPTLGFWNLVTMVHWLLVLLWTSAVAALTTLTSRARTTTNGEGIGLDTAGGGVPTSLAVVTGAGSGLGLAVAKRLHARGDTLVVMACRSVEEGLAAAQRIVATFDGEKERHSAARRLEVWQLELTDPKSILGFAKEIQESSPSSEAPSEEPFLAVYDVLRELGVDAELLGRIRSFNGSRPVRHRVEVASSPHNNGRRRPAEQQQETAASAPFDDDDELPPLGLLVNCAAMLAGSERRCLDGQLEATLASNVVGPHALQLCLLPSLVGGAALSHRPSRIITIGSFTHLAAGRACLNKALLDLRTFVTPARLNTSDGDRSVRHGPFRPAVEYMTSKLLSTMASFRVTARIQSARRGHTPAGTNSISSNKDASLPLLHSLVLDPGAMDTALVREWPAFLAAFFRVGLTALGLLHSTDSAAAAVLATASSPIPSCFPDHLGLMDDCYFAHWRGHLVRVKPSRLASRQHECERVWHATQKAARHFLSTRLKQESSRSVMATS